MALLCAVVLWVGCTTPNRTLRDYRVLASTPLARYPADTVYKDPCR